MPLRNPDFVGREELLEQLRLRLTTSDRRAAVLPEVLHGMGGIGKTQTAVEYIYRHAAEYDVVWWIPAEYTTQIRSSFVDLATRLDIRATSAEAVVSAVLDALRTGRDRRWLLVFDNAEHPYVVRSFLPSGGGHVVVTSRNSEWGSIADKVEVELFTRAESRELLRRREGGVISDDDADRLAETLGDLPLAIESAASLRRHTGMSVDEYLEKLEQTRAEFSEAGAPSGFALTGVAPWSVPLNRLRTARRGAYELLQVCAFFSPEPIPRGLFMGVDGVPVPSALAEVLADPIELDHAIDEICGYGLARTDRGRDTFQLHRLVQAALRDQLDEAQRGDLRQVAHVMLAGGDPGTPGDSAGWPTYTSLLPHAIASRAVDCDDIRVRTLLTNLHRFLRSAGVGLEALTPAGDTRPGDRHKDGMYVLCFVDVENYGDKDRTQEDRRALVKGMRESVERAFRQAGIPWDGAFLESSGDEMVIAVSAAGAANGAFVGSLLDRLLVALQDHNAERPAMEKVRLRLALHLCQIAFDDQGPDGPGLIHVARLLDAEPLRVALARTSGPLAVIVSDYLYTELVKQSREYAPDAYREVVVQVKKTRCSAWIRVPGHDLPHPSASQRFGQNLKAFVRRIVR